VLPPPGFKAELYPLRHRLVYSFGLSARDESTNTALCPLVRHTSDVIAGTPGSIIVNPHHTGYVTDAGPTVAKMSIIDKLSLTIKFNMTQQCNDRAHTSGQSTAEVFSGDGVHHLKFLWRPIFFSFGEKLDAADDDTGTTVETILGLTKDSTFEDVVPLTTNNLYTAGTSELVHPVSTVNIIEVFGDYNMTTDMIMEDHVWDEDLFHEALRRYTNKGALRACVGRTRHVNLSTERPFRNYYINKFVPRAIRRIVPYSFFGIQVHVPLEDDPEGDYHSINLTSGFPHVGCKIICNYHEWNADHYQEMSGTPP